MSVIKRKRGESEFEVLTHALNMRVAIDKLLLRDFGSKKRIKNYKIALSQVNITDDDMSSLMTILDKYDIGNIIDEYPEWYIQEARRSIKTICSNIVHNIIKANSVYPTTIPEYHERRNNQDRAIGYCEMLYIEFQHLMRVINVDVNKLIPFAEMIEKEIRLLKGWRKKDNKKLKQIKQKLREEEI